MKQHDRQGLNPGPPDPEFEVLTAQLDMPPDFPKAHRNFIANKVENLLFFSVKLRAYW